ncbi:carbon-nitrogen hydrolase family protein [Streptomyces sp. NPDC006475]|uniref:carbon-nitrogen hydrolase family protein n=1 Tax=Streptomyces sp. NPDC006475 TaxID=3155719 RepID=UPI0033BE4257
MKVAVVQTRWADDPADGLRNAHQAIEEATESGDVDVLCFPEFFLGPPWYMPGQDHLRGRTDTRIPGPVIETFQKLAQSTSTNMVLGAIVEELDDGKYSNTSLFLDRDGEIAGRASKAHMFGNEIVVCRAADSLGVIETDVGRVGLAVCSDFWVPEAIRVMALAGVHTVFVPGGTLRQNQALMVNALRTTAYLNGVNVVYASSVGLVEGTRGDRVVQIHFAGTSLVVSPEGVMAQAGSARPQILHADLAPPPEHNDGRHWLGMRRPKAYTPLLGEYAGMSRDLAEELRSNLAEDAGQRQPSEAPATSRTGA